LGALDQQTGSSASGGGSAITVNNSSGSGSGGGSGNGGLAGNNSGFPTTLPSNPTVGNQSGFGTLRYTLDGSAPNRGSPAYAAPVPVTLPLTVRASTFTPDGRILARRVRSFDAASLRRRDGNTLVNCPGNPFRLRVQPLPDATSWQPVYTINLFNACQVWPAAPLDGAQALHVELARLPDNYQLAHEANLVERRPAQSAHGELVIHRDRCDGPVLASLPLPDPATTPRRFALDARFARQQGTHDLCLSFNMPATGPLYAFGQLTLAGPR
jgi:hexosaminidase